MSRSLQLSGYPESFYLAVVGEGSEDVPDEDDDALVPDHPKSAWMVSGGDAVWLFSLQSMVPATVRLNLLDDDAELPDVSQVAGPGVEPATAAVTLPAGPLYLDQGPVGVEDTGLAVAAGTYRVVGVASGRGEIAAEVDRVVADPPRDYEAALDRLAGRETYELWLSRISSAESPGSGPAAA